MKPFHYESRIFEYRAALEFRGNVVWRGTHTKNHQVARAESELEANKRGEEYFPCVISEIVEIVKEKIDD